MAKAPVTPAIRELRKFQIEYSEHLYEYAPQGGTALGAHSLSVDEHAVIKTLVMENNNKRSLVVLMHGDKQVSTRQLARQLNVKSITPCAPKIATKYSGYQVGGTSPFGMRQTMPVYMQVSILELPWIYINGGRRGLLVRLSPKDLQKVLKPIVVNVAI